MNILKFVIYATIASLLIFTSAIYLNNGEYGWAIFGIFGSVGWFTNVIPLLKKHDSPSNQKYFEE